MENLLEILIIWQNSANLVNGLITFIPTVRFLSPAIAEAIQDMD